MNVRLSIFFLLQAFVLSATSSVYPELDYYYETLQPDHTLLYEQALEKYLSEQPVKTTYSVNPKINERFETTINLPENNEEQLFEKTNALLSIAEDANRRREYNLELTCLHQAFMISFYDMPIDYRLAFSIALTLENRLAKVDEKQYPQKRASYFKLGEAYYLSKEYEKSIMLLKNAITNNPPVSFTDCTNLDARKIIGICYANINQMDTSDYYFMSTLKSRDIVLNRPVYNATALAHLGCNAMIRGDYEKALILDQEVLPFLKQQDDYGHIAGMYACQCFSYFNLNALDQVNLIKDSVLHYAEKDTYNKNKRLKQAYSILFRFYALKGDIGNAFKYNDSLLSIYQNEEKHYTSQYMLQAVNKQITEKEEEVRQQHYFIIVSFIIFIIIFTCLCVVLFFYRRQRYLYKELIKKSESWAASESIRIQSENKLRKPCKEDVLIVQTTHLYLTKHKPYKDLNFTIDSLAGLLNINRNKLSKAINQVTEKNFNQFINEYRVKEAINLMTDDKNRALSLDELMEQAGFSGRTSFYQIFKKMTGLSPAEYRKNKGIS